MPPASPPEQFWLMTGNSPTGPYTVARVHAEIAAGRATWQTPACPVGCSAWLPLLQTPGVGPGVSARPPMACIDPTAAAPALRTLGRYPALARVRRLYAERPAAVRLWGLAALAVGIYLAIKGITVIAGGPAHNAHAVDVGPNDVASPAAEAKETTYRGWYLATEPRLPTSMQDPAELLAGSWRFRGAGAYCSTFRFESDGSFAYYVSGSNAFINWPVADLEAYGRWSVRDGTLFVEYTGANKEALLPLFRGLTGRSPIRFTSANAVQLSGVEGDQVTRTYERVR